MHCVYSVEPKGNFAPVPQPDRLVRVFRVGRPGCVIERFQAPEPAPLTREELSQFQTIDSWYQGIAKGAYKI